MKHILKNTISLDRKTASIRLCLKTLKKMVSNSRKKIWLSSNCNNGFKKKLMKEYHFHKTENSLPNTAIKDSLEIYFDEIEKLLPMEEKFEKLEQDGFY